MMLIFLDMDGVMLPQKGWQLPENMEDGFPMFSKRATEALGSLLTEYSGSNIRIVLSTSHRDRFTINEWISIFERRGLTVRDVERLPSNKDFSKKRKDELLEWFQTHLIVDDFLIIDDDKSLNALPMKFKEHLVLTRSSVGLTLEDLPVVA